MGKIVNEDLRDILQSKPEEKIRKDLANTFKDMDLHKWFDDWMDTVTDEMDAFGIDVYENQEMVSREFHRYIGSYIDKKLEK